MNQLQNVFDYEGHQVRTVIIHGEPWFVAKDVCLALGLTNTSMAIRSLDDDEKGVSKVYTPGGEQEMAIVNEPGLYTLILRSNKPDAKKFKRWITHEVLPALRRTGSYSIQPKTPAEMILLIAEQLVAQEKRLQEIEQKAIAAHHRIDNLDRIDIIGDPQQRLNAMVKKYALSKGLTFQQAWREFRQAFNTAYRTNLTMLIENYKLKHGIRELTMPEYLARVGRLDDAIRVADKLLNQAS